MSRKIKVGVSICDINGIGMGEIILKTFKDKRMQELCTPRSSLVHPKVSFTFHRKSLGIEDFSFNIINSVEDVISKKQTLSIVGKEESKIDLGKSTTEGGKFAFKSCRLLAKPYWKSKLMFWLPLLSITKYSI